MPASWASTILLCAGFAILSLRQTRYANSDDIDIASRGRRYLPGTDDTYAGDDDLSSDHHRHGGGVASADAGDDIHEYDALGGMADFIQPEDGTIRSISLLGERNSGTRWIYGHLSECFNHTIPVERHLSRYKHWFQYDDPNVIPRNTLAIAMFRDPMTWTWAMKEVPHHATEHIDLPWEEFVTKEWNMERVCDDLTWLERQKNNNNNASHDDDDGRVCQENFRYHEVVSCLVRPCPDGYWATPRRHRYSRHQPFYEMRVNDPLGRPYDNILEMRADKIRNFVESATYSNVDGYWHYKYESLLRTGTRDLVERIERATGVRRDPDRCRVYGPQERRSRPMDPDFFDYMIEHVDWSAEELVGYRRPEQPRSSGMGGGGAGPRSDLRGGGEEESEGTAEALRELQDARRPRSINQLD